MSAKKKKVHSSNLHSPTFPSKKQQGQWGGSSKSEVPSKMYAPCDQQLLNPKEAPPSSRSRFSGEDGEKGLLRGLPGVGGCLCANVIIQTHRTTQATTTTMRPTKLPGNSPSSIRPPRSLHSTRDRPLFVQGKVGQLLLQRA